MGNVRPIIWITPEYDEEKRLATQLHLEESRRYHARRAGLGMCPAYHRSGSEELAGGRFHSTATVNIRGQLRVTAAIWWACGCRYKRDYTRQLHHYQDGDQLRIAVEE